MILFFPYVIHITSFEIKKFAISLEKHFITLLNFEPLAHCIQLSQEKDRETLSNEISHLLYQNF